MIVGVLELGPIDEKVGSVEAVDEIELVQEMTWESRFECKSSKARGDFLVDWYDRKR